jgi:nucleoside-diphosphate-sugar epimerase
MAALHVIFGAGQIGPLLAERLLAAGLRVRVARRSAGPIPAGAELARGDAAERGFCAEAARGAAVVYHCMNPVYDRKAWAALVPRFMENLLAAAGGAGARLVALDNVYMLGAPRGQVLSEDTPMRPTSRKGEIRAAAARRLLEASLRGEVRALTARASDFYGPGGVGTYFGPQFWKPVLAGKAAPFLVNPDTPHTYHFVRDVAAGLAALGAAEDDVLGKVWMLPCAPAVSSRAMVDRFAAALGRPIALRRLPRLALRAIGAFVPIVRELNEMAYQWDEPFVVDDRRFRARFPEVAPTSLDEGAKETVDWALATFGQGRARR